jgi:transcriptional regulator GlxA family with amidase domain
MLKSKSDSISVGFLLLPKHSLLATVLAIEALRFANQVLGRKAYDWTLYAPQSSKLLSSSELALSPSSDLGAALDCDVLFVCASYEALEHSTMELMGLLRRANKKGVILGGIETGALVLARTGLMNGYRAACHWDELEVARERFPRVQFVDDIFVVDRNRITCAGGTTSLDMMLYMLAEEYGKQLSYKVSHAFLHTKARSNAEQQIALFENRFKSADPIIQKALRLAPGVASEGKGVEALLKATGVSRKYLEKKFVRWTNTTPGAYLRNLRLDRARSLLKQSDFPLIQIAMECGFSSASQFSTAYKKRFGLPPSRDRS